MIALRHQPPVHSPVTVTGILAGLAGAAGAAVGWGGAVRARLAAAIANDLSAASVILTDSGTSALVLAFRMLVRETRVVALPAYGCLDPCAAAAAAGMRVRLYDLDPHTLSPDLDSLRRVVAQGVDVIVVAHLFGYPVDVVGVRTLAKAVGAPIVEDAAQGAGGRLHGLATGSFGDLTVLSFGRGKGGAGGGGGALVIRRRSCLATGAVTTPIRRGAPGMRELVATGAQWMLARPAVYAIPAALPWLHLGEMRYRAPREPRAIAASSAAMALVARGRIASEAARRRQLATQLARVMTNVRAVRPIHGIDGALPGFLRLPVCVSPSRDAAPRLGIVRPYPHALRDVAAVQSHLASDAEPLHGARELAASLLTLPTHRHVTSDDVRRIGEWITAGDSRCGTDSGERARSPAALSRN